LNVGIIAYVLLPLVTRMLGLPQDVSRRLVQAFGEREPSPEAIHQHIATLKQQAHHLWPTAPVQAAGGVPPGMVSEVWAKMTPESRLGWWREHHPQQPVARRPTPLTLTPEQVAQLAALPVVQRMTEYRRLQAEQGGAS
jgi:hypothetical protein